MEEMTFSLRDQYLFCFKEASTGPTVFTTHPCSISDTELRFFILDRYKPETVSVRKKDVLAVYDNTYGTVQIRGYYGKYRILNKTLFDQYIQDKVLELHR